MAIDYSANKGIRLLKMHELLQKGEYLSKKELGDLFGVSAKTIQRDIEDLRAYFADEGEFGAEDIIEYDRARCGYRLKKLSRDWLTSSEVMAICKILLESRGFCKKEAHILIDKLLAQVNPIEKPQVEEMILNEKNFYIEPRHGKVLLEKLWDLARCIKESRVIQVNYERQDGVSKEYSLKPVAIMFSEFYFYLIAYKFEDTPDYPIVFRIDRFQSIKETKEKFLIPYSEKFDESEFRKRVIFMYAGELRRIKFKFNGPSLEAILDKIPTAKAERIKGEDAYLVTAEAYGSGMEMWLRSQGDWVEMM